MHSAARALGRVVLILNLAILATTSFAADRQRIQVESYVIQAVVTPQTHQLKAVAQVKFTALDDISIATFQLHNGLRPIRVLDAEGQTLSAERISQDSTVRVSLPAGLSKGASSMLIFEYEGTLQSSDDSPVPGLKLAYIGDPISHLLYAGAWFPMVGYGVNRFTSTIGISAPTEYKVIGSGKESMGSMPAIGENLATPSAAARKGAPARSGPTKLAVPAGYSTRTFTYSRASFPGTILIGKYEATKSNEGGLDVTVYTSEKNKSFAQAYAET
ncbi:MAG TPA: peptidase M1, partial [Candidatus Angelobacter sp.]|nr:peptidase M1 [Candidatus Angelobacter sp.]